MIPLVFPPQMSFWQAFQGGLVEARKDPKYIAYLHTLPCAVMNTRKAITVHHVIGHGLRGHSTKTCDYLAFPIEAELHLPDYPRSIHAMNFGWKRWEEVHGSQLLFTMQTLVRAVHEGFFK